MTEPTMETLARRLVRLERENRRLKRIGALTLAIMAVVGLMGQATVGKVPRVIEAKTFVLRDTKGTARAVLDATVHGPVFALYDDEGTQRAAFVVRELGPALILYDGDGNTRVELGSGYFITTRMGIVEKRPESSLVLFNKKGKVIWSAP